MSKKGSQAQRTQGMVNRAQGKLFEERIDAALAYYDRLGVASVEKTPEPMRPLKRLSEGRFVAVFEKPAQPDYKGTLQGGRAVVFEAKHTTTGQMECAAGADLMPCITRVCQCRCVQITALPVAAP